MNWYFQGIPLLSKQGQSWIASRTGLDISLDRYLLYNGKAAYTLSTVPSAPIQPSRYDLVDVPDEGESLQAHSFLMRSRSRFIIPTLSEAHLVEILETVHRPDSHPTSGEARKYAKACIWSLHALASQLPPARHLVSVEDGQTCAEKALACLGVVPSGSTAECLHAVLMLVSCSAVNRASASMELIFI